ncbi:MAG: protein-glutamate O-methyltransferase CheR [Pseudomonadales bacterium]|nr:protein-glutamate O-methyltransferase CheR [Pseudomonadales bacterium]NRA18453.1 protein-glutamate O-methyltransferase CheR [Oceanospirillaceae bacterium]
MQKKDSLEFEINHLLEAILYQYGYDFRHYARASLERRVLNRLHLADLQHVTELTSKILHDPEYFDLFLKDMSITVTEMFRDPSVFKAIRKSVCSRLRTYSRVNIWHAGCATGEEVYSMAIMLQEEDLLSRTQIYATDFNNHSLTIAKEGIYPAEKMQLFTENYQSAGGQASFADYYQAKYQFAKFKDSLKKHITFANHNLIKDQVFASMHLVMCRNVLIYFDQQLQNQVLGLFQESLVHRGYLVLGDKETLEFSAVDKSFESVDTNARIYRIKTDV